MKKQFERPLIKKIRAGIPSKFGMSVQTDPITHIEDTPVADIVKQYGSPVFVISEKSIRDTYREAKRAFETRYPRVQFAWSYKTNYLDAVCKIFHQEGSWAEVVSGFEYDKAIANGVESRFIIFNGPDKHEDDLDKAIRNDSLIHIDHLEELYTIIRLATSPSHQVHQFCANSGPLTRPATRRLAEPTLAETRQEPLAIPPPG